MSQNDLSEALLNYNSLNNVFNLLIGDKITLLNASVTEQQLAYFNQNTSSIFNSLIENNVIQYNEQLEIYTIKLLFVIFKQVVIQYIESNLTITIPDTLNTTINDYSFNQTIYLPEFIKDDVNSFITNILNQQNTDINSVSTLEQFIIALISVDSLNNTITFNFTLLSILRIALLFVLNRLSRQVTNQTIKVILDTLYAQEYTKLSTNEELSLSTTSFIDIVSQLITYSTNKYVFFANLKEMYLQLESYSFRLNTSFSTYQYLLHLNTNYISLIQNINEQSTTQLTLANLLLASIALSPSSTVV